MLQKYLDQAIHNCVSHLIDKNLKPTMYNYDIRLYAFERNINVPFKIKRGEKLINNSTINIMDSPRKTDFESVEEFNVTFGVPVFKEPQMDIFTREPHLVKLRLDLIREEFKELETAVENHDMVETLDALADLIYVVQGMACSFGLNLDKAFDIVHKSNMSKVCKDEEEAKKTVEYYEKNKDKLGYDSPAYRLSQNKKFYVVYNKNTGKVLKNINYVPANFESILTQKNVD